MAGLIMFGGFALLLILGVPIALSLGVATLSAIALDPAISVSLNTVGQRIFGGLDSTSIMAIAFFVLAGNLMTKGGISSRICDFCRSIIGGIRGGMGVVLVLSCAFFAALSGSAPATVVAIGVMLYPDMVKMGYPKERVVPEQRNKKILDGVRAQTLRPLTECLDRIDQDLLKGAIAGEKFQELFIANCKDQQIADYIRKLL